MGSLLLITAGGTGATELAIPGAAGTAALRAFATAVAAAVAVVRQPFFS
jgi:hypothetical protein